MLNSARYSLHTYNAHEAETERSTVVGRQPVAIA